MPRRKLSDDDRAELLRLRAQGSSLNDLAAAFDVYGAACGAARARQCPEGHSPEAPAPLTLDEAEQHLAKAVRAGSVGALKLWFDRHGSEEPAGDDPFAQFDPPVVR